ncbi:hypothetical protein VM57_04135 [Stenotrophomonas maltophilia]|uniref:Uncharacterized protein n=1 Tax=Stenotrophomonas maltophilia TaxID=40324 RepID=A0A0F5ZPC2_STEMA|nr:hypothetical protein VM57_04135 [Stenotrophomonas maltophilia]
MLAVFRISLRAGKQFKDVSGDVASVQGACVDQAKILEKKEPFRGEEAQQRAPACFDRDAFYS